MLFKVFDYENNPVMLTAYTWHQKLLDPIIGHPEVEPYFSLIPFAIKNPDFVFQSIRDVRSKLFFIKIREGSLASYYLVVVVKYVKEQEKIIGYVSTVMINRTLPKKSKLLWAIKVSN